MLTYSCALILITEGQERHLAHKIPFQRSGSVLETFD